jgi:tRNA A37 threonylcarbamoyltransferase TsaD
VDGIAVTRGPGLEICLRVGLRKAQVVITATLPAHHLPQLSTAPAHFIHSPLTPQL